MTVTTVPHVRRATGLRRRTLIACWLISGLAAAASAQLVADDDHRDVPAPHDVLVTAAWLLANDLAAAQVTIEIVEPPSFGSLVPVAGGFLYSLDGPFFGVETFTYRLRSGGDSSAPARVTLRFFLNRQPLAGRWPTASCAEPSCPGCDMGVGAEVGFYDRDTRTFAFCDWQGGETLDDCRYFRVPFFVEAGGMPFVIDWDGDGWDEPALHDPGAGRLLLFDEAGWMCSTPREPLCLSLALSYDLEPSLGAAARHVFPLGLGTPFNGFSQDAVGVAVYDAVAGVLHHSWNGSRFSSIMPFTHGIDAVPTVGGWPGTSSGNLGLWSNRLGSLRYATSLRGLGLAELEPDLQVRQPKWPLAVATDRCSPATLGLYDPCDFGLDMLSLEPPNLARARVYVNVPTDPAGYPDAPSDPQPICPGAP